MLIDVFKGKKHFLILIPILFLASFLRIYKLTSDPIWYDEAVSISHAEKALGFYFTSPRVNYKPVYFLLLKIWLSLFGEGSFGLRLFSVIWGMLSIFLVYKIGKILFDTKVGLISSFLLSISVFHIYHCQQVRHFSFLVFLTLFSVFYFIKFIKKNKISDIFFCTLGNILILNTHPYGLSVCIFEAFFAIFYLKNPSRRRWFFSQSFLLIFVILWLVLPNKEHIKELIWWISRPDFKALVETFDTFSWGGPRYGLDDFRINEDLLKIPKLLSPVYLMLIFLAPIKNRGTKDTEKLVFLTIWLVIPILISFVFSIIGELSIYAIKHFLFVLPAFYLLAAKGLSNLGSRLRGFFLVLIAFLTTFPLGIMYNNNFNTDWRESTEYVKRHIRKGEIIITSVLKEIVPFIYYFKNQKYSLKDIDIYGKIEADKNQEVFWLEKEILLVGIKEQQTRYQNNIAWNDFKKKIVDDSTLRNKNIWVMLSRWTRPEDKDAMLEYLDKNYCKIDERHFQGVDVFYFKALTLNKIED